LNKKEAAMVEIAFLIIGAGAGGALVYFILQTNFAGKLTAEKLLAKEFEERAEGLRKELFQIQEAVKTREGDIKALQEEKLQLSSLNAAIKASMEEERKAAAEKLALINEAKEKLSDAFKALSQDSLKSSSESFIQLAEKVFKNLQTEAKGDLEQKKQAVENLVNPIKESLEKAEKFMREIETGRKEEYGSLSGQIRQLSELERNLQKETANLVTALKAPVVRGSWGEQTLRRVVEMAGLNEYCDFVEQDSLRTKEGLIRPDMIVRMPGDRVIIVDAKNIFQYYYEAMEYQDEVRRNEFLDKHVRAVKEHIKKLSQKSYWEQYENAADFVIFFMPNENLYTEALKRDAGIFEMALQQRILPAHPVSLAGFLQLVGHTWKQQKLSENAAKIQELGRELYDRLVKMAEHFTKVGNNLGKTVEAYNDTVRSMESRVLVTARKMEDLGISGKEKLMEIGEVDKKVTGSIVRESDTKKLPE